MPEPNHSVDKSPCDFRTFVQNMSLINTTVSNTFLPTLLVRPRCYNSGFSLPDCLEHLFASIHGASENFNSPQHQSKTSWLRARDGKTTTAAAIYHFGKVSNEKVLRNTDSHFNLYLLEETCWFVLM